MEIYFTNGVDSTRIARILQGWMIASFANPAAPVFTAYDWIATGGYTDNALLDGTVESGARCTLSIVPQGGSAFATIYQGGNAVLAQDVPYFILAAQPTLPLIAFNVPRLAGVYDATLTITKPNGEDTIIEIWSFQVRQ